MRRIGLVMAIIPFLLGNDGGCATTGQQSGKGIAKPAGWMLADCEDLPDIPAAKDEAKAEVRRSYYKTSRIMYAQCKARHGGLKAFATTVTSR